MKKNIFKKYFQITITMFIFFNSVVNANGTAVDGTVSDILTEILQVLLGVGAAVCVGKLIHIGILYMTSSAVEKSNAKSAMLPWLIGTIVCFGAGWIGPWIVELFRIDGPVLSIN